LSEQAVSSEVSSKTKAQGLHPLGF
jgi:hypothetical protein